MIAALPATPMLLAGDAHERGLAQAACGSALIAATQRAIDQRMTASAAWLGRADVGAFLDEQIDVMARIDPDGAAEIAGIAEAFDRPYRTVVAYLHLSVVADLAVDGCSSWAWGGPAACKSGDGPLLVKNRDYRGEHEQLQRVFLHRDPSRPGEAILCVGSLGSPGAFSSGINAHGFALVDTHVSSRDHGPGLLRYVLMTRLLWRCRSVAEALWEIDRVPVAGGGTLVMADAAGATAAVELGHRTSAFETGGLAVARTNHFVSPQCAPAWLTPASPAAVASTHGRLARLQAWLKARPGRPSLADAAALMGTHDEDGGAALCCHAEGDGSRTISCSLFAPAARRLYFSAGHPCRREWSLYDCLP